MSNQKIIEGSYHIMQLINEPLSLETKRQKINKQSSLQPFSKDQWIQLATLYNSINEHEVFSSLYSENIASKEIATSKHQSTSSVSKSFRQTNNAIIVAIDAESEGDYLKASNLLLDLIEQSSEEVGYTEVSIL
jgi:hypothetical protein